MFTGMQNVFSLCGIIKRHPLYMKILKHTILEEATSMAFNKFGFYEQPCRPGFRVRPYPSEVRR